MFGTVLAFVFFYEDSPHRALAAASFALLIPIFGVLSSVVILGGELGPNTVVGAVAVIAGALADPAAPGAGSLGAFGTSRKSTDSLKSPA